MFSIFLTGFSSSLLQIIAIGMQNSFVLKCGLRKNHVFLIATICILCDISLITLSIFGIAGFVMKSAWLMKAFQLSGAAFLIIYGLKSIKKAIKNTEMLVINESHPEGKGRLILTALAVSFLNPSCWVDTVLVIGSLSSEYVNFGERFIFYLGSILASAGWFYLLGYGAVLLSKFLSAPITWKILDFCMGVMMLYLAIGLIR